MTNLEPTNLLDEAYNDMTITRLKYRAYSYTFQWQKAIRE